MEKLSKILSYILRHNPERYNLRLTDQGWVDINELIKTLKITHDKFSSITYMDVIRLIEIASKKRHDIHNGQIRAIYEHSINVAISYEEVQPPEHLYHGTTLKSIPSILGKV